MKKYLLLILLAILFSDCYPQNFPFDSIPGKLKKGACAVVRSEQCLISISRPGEATMKVKIAVTLLNEESSSLRYVSVGYNNFIKVNYLRGKIYDEKGETIKSLGALDVFDINAIPGGTFYSDDRMKVLYFPVHRYPFTIEFEYEISINGMIDYPKWEFQSARNISVEKSGIQYIVPEGMRLRYFEQNLKNPVDSFKTGTTNVYTWMETNIPAKPVLKNRNLTEFLKPVLYCAPVDFEFGGIKGSLESWQSLGKWVWELNRDRDAIPADEQKVIKDLVSKATNEKDLIRLIYEYVQSKTRYLSVQIGIGGNRTALAEEVSRNGFGDCKALVNYTMALLKVAGVQSYYTLVKSGVNENDINTGFVYDYFDHVILCVPQKQDTVWLECTNQNNPFNYLGPFTSDRHVLLITPEGGKLAHTPSFRKEDNILTNSGSVFVNATGTSSVILKTTGSGYYYSELTGLFSLESEEGIKKNLYSFFEYPDITVTSARYTENKSSKPSGQVEYQAKINEMGTRQGNKLYLAPSVSRTSFVSSNPDIIKIPVSGSAKDSITYFLPTGYKIDTKPVDTNLKSEFGSYSMKFSAFDDRIIFVRNLQLNEGRVSPDKYSEFRKFINAMARSDREVIVLSRANL